MDDTLNVRKNIKYGFKLKLPSFRVKIKVAEFVNIAPEKSK